MLQMGIRVLGGADRAAEVVIADVVTESVVDGLLQTEHHAAALVHAAVVVLVHRAVAGVGIDFLCLTLLLTEEGYFFAHF